ncbi:ATP-dependent helicase HrpB [Desulfatiferula olefinivorans]
MRECLPIESSMADIRNALEHKRTAVVEARPGAGKTTLVPLLLLDEPWLAGKNIVILEPRRLAARMAAARMADLLGEPVGHTVGYQIKNDRKISARTRIHVLTEGILTRKIQSDPLLDDTGLVIFDEFHERNLVSDLGLALCLEIREALRQDLGILVMSATLDSEPVARLINQAPLIRCEGRQFPVETIYLKRKPQGDLETACTACVVDALSQHEGDILVFLPGAGEIRRVQAQIEAWRDDPHLSVYPLYGNLDKKDQDAAVRPSPPGKRKIVLATAIAETSLTIEGVRIVIDSGLMRKPRYFSGTGMSRLETLPVSQAGADQRRGRAGRLGPGICYRLWTEDETALHPEFSSPEILNTDLTSLVLELAVWGVQRPDQLKWLDLPPQGAFDQARELLMRLGALHRDQTISAHGKALAALGLHPRLAHMLVEGKAAGKGGLACLTASLLQEGDIMTGSDPFRSTDIRDRLSLLEAFRQNNMEKHARIPVNTGRCRSILKNARVLEQRLNIRPGPVNVDEAGAVLALAYPERIALSDGKAPGAFKLASGMAAGMPVGDYLAGEPMIVCADMDGNRTRSRIYLAAPVDRFRFEELFKDLIETDERVIWDGHAVVSVKRTTYGRLVLSERTEPCTDEDRVLALMISLIRDKGLDLLPWTRHLREFRERIRFLRRVDGFGDLPDVDDAALVEHLDTWLAPFLGGIRSLSQLKKLDLSQAFFSLLSWNQRQTIDAQAPTHLTVPSGSRIPLSYGTGRDRSGSPVLAVRLQEMFGLTETPRIAGGKVPVTVHLLSPSGRPVQVTRDLESFWKTTYDQVKKDLKGRYPKHYWPDDPLNAAATHRTKKSMDRQ